MSQTCPRCGSSEQHWIGHEIRGVYDGVLFWQCQGCGLAFQRWEPDDRLHERAQVHIDKANERGGADRG